MLEEVENQDAEHADKNEKVREEAKTKTEPVIEPHKPSDNKFVSTCWRLRNETNKAKC